ncbi:MAG: hypothetical protein OEW39_12585 [Deltaproteobacteria bacterium]|nr:hypothetical protein [Deltaproteobacteria bacterium]
MSKGKGSSKTGKVKEQVSFFDMEEEAPSAKRKGKSKAAETPAVKPRGRPPKAAKEEAAPKAPVKVPEKAPKIAAKGVVKESPAKTAPAKEAVAPRKEEKKGERSEGEKAVKVAKAGDLAPEAAPTNGAGHVDASGEAEPGVPESALMELGMDAKGAWKILPDGTRENLSPKEWRVELTQRYKRSTPASD